MSVLFFWDIYRLFPSSKKSVCHSPDHKSVREQTASSLIEKSYPGFDRDPSSPAITIDTKVTSASFILGYLLLLLLLVVVTVR